MKTISKFLFIFLILFHAALLYAGSLRATVILFESKPDDKGLDKRMSIICSEEVIRSKGFVYISPTEFTKTVTGNEKMLIDKTVDLEKEYSVKNMEYLQEMSKSDNNSFDRMFKALASTDVIIGGTVERNGSLVKVELMMNSGLNRKQYDVTVECEEDRLDAEMRKKVRNLLKNISKPVKIYADKLIDAEKSMVIYLVKAMDKADIIIEMDYTGDRPDPQIQNVKILPPDGVNKDGMMIYRIKSDEGRIIDVEFTFKGGKLDAVRVDTPIPDSSKATKQSEILTVKSAAGYALKFEFVWDKGAMESAKLYPALNPFGDYEE